MAVAAAVPGSGATRPAASLRGVLVGGRWQCRFCKDLDCSPSPVAKATRADLLRVESLWLGLKLDRDLDRHMRIADTPLRPLRIPDLGRIP